MTETHNGELELWERARHNDGEAFGLLFDLHRDRVYHRALGLLSSVHDAEDVTSAVFFELWRMRRSVRQVDGSVLPWLLVTTVNLCRNSRRSASRYHRFLQSLPRDEATAAADDVSIETKQRLLSSLRHLSAVDSSLFALTSLEGMTISQAAETLGLKASTARMRLHRARARLRSELHDLNPSLRQTIEETAP